jgi:trans-2,3-dihydro-3-hydroxyanthranilate isomerase
MRALAYELCDVFTDRPLAGNALAVFLDAQGLGDVTLQALARETNLSETAFVLPPETSEADARIRIFTPTMELPFAGHPTLGSAIVLGASLGHDTIWLETPKGIVSVRLTRTDGRPTFGWMTQPLPRVTAFDGMDLFEALGVAGSGLPVEVYDNGPRYVLVDVGSPEQVRSLCPDMGHLARFGSLAFVTFARDGDRWKVRVFAPGEGIAEDPGTGAAAGPLAWHLARHGRVPFDSEVVIDQGAEIARPSRLYARVVGTSERLERVEVGGAAVLLGRGEVRLDDAAPGITASTPGTATAPRINRGDVFWIGPDPSGGPGSSCAHPHVVVQDDVINRSRVSTVVVCALTSNLHRSSEPGNVLLDAGEANLPRPSVVVVSQISSVDKASLGAPIGCLSSGRVEQILAGLRFQQASFFRD